MDQADGVPNPAADRVSEPHAVRGREQSSVGVRSAGDGHPERSVEIRLAARGVKIATPALKVVVAERFVWCRERSFDTLQAPTRG
jgi:hypothetical protein